MMMRETRGCDCRGGGVEKKVRKDGCCTKLNAFVVYPYDHRYRTWEIYLVLLVIYTAWVSPFEFCFLDNPEGNLAITDNIVNVFFCIDIILTFFVAYHDKTTNLIVEDKKKIARKYASSCLVFDLVSIIPSEVSTRSPILTGGFFNLFRLWRVRRVGTLFARLEKNKSFCYFWVRCARLFCVTLFTVHCAGCFYYLLASRYRYPDKKLMGGSMRNFLQSSLSTKYVASIYWSMTTLSTVGYGDLHAEGTKEMLFDILYMLFDLGLTSYIIGNITHLAVHNTQKTRQLRGMLQAASDFARRNHLPDQIHDQMLAHLSLKFRTDSEGLLQENLDVLPKAICSSISNFLFYSLVSEVYLFNGVSDVLLFQLVSELKAEYFPPGQDVILQKEAQADFYILASGAVDLLVTSGAEQVVGEAKTGDVCGEIAVLCNRPHLFTVRTRRKTQLLRMDRTTFMNTVQDNVKDGIIIFNNLLQHLREQKDPIMEGILPEAESMLAHYSKDLDPNNSNTKGRAVSTNQSRDFNRRRIRVSCPEKGDNRGKIVFIPQGLNELLEIAAKMYEFYPAKIILKGGVEIEDIEVIRDGDHIVFAGDGGGMIN